MQELAEPVTKLIDAFSKLPGIGPKTASRLTYFLLRSDESISLELAEALQELKANVLFCSVCHNIADRDPCPICASPQRDHSVICVVEEPLDVQAVERTRAFHGVYHVLHGSISPMEGRGPDDLKIAQLLQRVQQGNPAPEAEAGAGREGAEAGLAAHGENGAGAEEAAVQEATAGYAAAGPAGTGAGTEGPVAVQEILLATNPNLEGDATAMYIARLVKPLGLRVTRLAHGLPVGGDLEYADDITLGRALSGRSDI